MSKKNEGVPVIVTRDIDEIECPACGEKVFIKESRLYNKLHCFRLRCIHCKGIYYPTMTLEPLPKNRWVHL